MNKREFLAQLKKALSGLPQEDINERLTFYSEMIDDQMEEGLSEADAVAAVGAVNEIAAQAVADTPLVKIAKERIKPARKLHLFTAAMTRSHWDFTNLSTVNYETNAYEISEEFTRLSLNTDIADISLVLSGDGKCRVECFEEASARHSVAVEDGELVIRAKDERAWYAHLGLRFGRPRITVYLPHAEYGALTIREATGNIGVPKGFRFDCADISLSTGDATFCASADGAVSIKTTTGDIRVENIAADSLDLSATTGHVTVSGVTCAGDVTVGVTTGKVRLTDVACSSLSSNGKTGALLMERVMAAQQLTVRRTTGSVHLDGCDAAALSIETSTGDVAGSLLTEKVFAAETSTGKIDVPKGTTGGLCEIKTTTGSIRMDVAR